MLKFIKSILSLLTLALLFSGCSSSDDGDRTALLELDIIGLQTLGQSFEYEGWFIVDGQAVSTGKFVDVNFPKQFRVDAQALNAATAFFLTIEPGNDNDPGPSDTRILQGNFSGNAASLSIDQAIGNFNSASGQFVMETPTDQVAGNDQAGLYFKNPNVEPPVPGLNLPDLGPGWKYNAWVRFPTANGGSVDVATGSFTRVDVKDEFSPYSGNETIPEFPGEDFLNNDIAPPGVTFPGDVRGKVVYVSIEPFPDTSQGAFFLQPLRGVAGQEVFPTLNTLSVNSASFPLGTVRR
ncbi:hypothetical protein [Croceiramulus getboli]|nr:hypothetical protein P8624_14515 [Flavobacteriaceae bacterium YJPT1-3]